MQRKDGTMKQLINSKHLSTLIFILSIIVMVKLIWIILSFLFLPSSGEEFQEANKAKKLYYRVRLTNESNVIAPVKTIQATKTEVSSMSGYKLLGLYNSKKKLVVTVEKGRKTSILEKGEKVDGFKLIGADSIHAFFKKNEEEFKLTLMNTKEDKQVGSRIAAKQHYANKTASKTNAIVDQGGTKVISRTLLTSYTKDLDKIWKDIGLAQHKSNGKLNGFNVNFVRKGSDFEKLGLKRGDILKAINAEELNSLSTAINFFKEINNIDNLTLTVERNGKSEDLEYEIQ